MQRVLQQCCKTSPAIQALEEKDDALHKQLMRTTSSLDEQCYGISGKETSRDKMQCKAVGGPNKFLKLDCKQFLFFFRFTEGCRARDSLAAIKETERSLFQLTWVSYQGTYGFQIRMED